MKNYCVTYRRSYENTGEDKVPFRGTIFGTKELYWFGGDKKKITNNVARRSIESIFGV